MSLKKITLKPITEKNAYPITELDAGDDGFRSINTFEG